MLVIRVKQKCIFRESTETPFFSKIISEKRDILLDFAMSTFCGQFIF
jgi:hypothetical protein